MRRSDGDEVGSSPLLRRGRRVGEGVVARYDADRGFGFITPDAGGADLFVHMSVLVGAVPPRYGFSGAWVDPDTYFAMARGSQGKGRDVTAMYVSGSTHAPLNP